MPRAVALLMIAALVLTACGSSSGGTATRNDDDLPEAIQQASVAFDGSPSGTRINSQLDQAFDHFDLEPTNDNYSRAASTLIALRQSAQDRGCETCDEMAILSHMLRSNGWEAGLDFPEAAAFSLEAMMVGDQ